MKLAAASVVLSSFFATSAIADDSAMKFSAEGSAALSREGWKNSFDGWNVTDYSTFPYTVSNTGKFSYSNTYLNLAGRVLVPLVGNFGVQGDFAWMDGFKSENSDNFHSSNHVAAHLLFRDDGFQAGAFYALGRAVHTADQEDYPTTIYGIEGQVYYDHSTIWGQLGKIKSFERGGPSEYYNPTQLRAGIRWFPRDDIRIDLQGSVMSGKTDNSSLGNGNINVYSFSLGAEKEIQLGNLPAAVFGTYTYTAIPKSNSLPLSISFGGQTFDWTTGYGGSSSTILVGVKFRFGTDSLRDQDRHGVNTDVDFTRAGMLDLLYDNSSMTITANP